MKTEHETGYNTAFSDNFEYQKGKWVFMQKTVLVQPEIDKLNIRIDADTYRNRGGNAWFDDIKIEQLDLSQNEIVSETNYYPFGLAHKGYNEHVSSTNKGQDYKFNGVELNSDMDLGLYEMDYRFYDPVVPRFTTIDPMAEQRYWMSPYNFGQNNPISRVDPTGLLDDYGIDKKTGEITLIKITNDNTDTLYAGSGKGESFKKDESKGSVTVNKDSDGSSVISDLSSENSVKSAMSTGQDTVEEITINTAETSSQNDAFSVFKFASDNSNVEWSLHKSMGANGNTGYTLGTYHLNDLSPGFDNLGGTRSWLGGIHSHPNQNTQFERSESIYGDAYYAKKYFNKYGENKPYDIYFPNTGGSVRLSNPKESHLKKSRIMKKSFKTIKRF